MSCGVNSGQFLMNWKPLFGLAGTLIAARYGRLKRAWSAFVKR